MSLFQTDQSQQGPKLSPKFVINALNLEKTSPSNPPPFFKSVTIDSRQVEPGVLFTAIKGENFDGHDFIESALTAGATGVICRKGTSISPSLLKDKMAFYVDDPIQAFRRLAGAWRKEFSIPIIAVAGSAGKTTTKELLSAILSGKFSSVLKTQASQNGFVGIPMTLLNLRPHHQAAVIEVGIDETGAMEQHMTLVAPQAAILTAIGPEHLERLHNLATVAFEEGIALTHVAKTGGIAAVNLDDPWIHPHFDSRKEDARRIGFTLSTESLSPGPLTHQSSANQERREMIFGRINANGDQLSFKGRLRAKGLISQSFEQIPWTNLQLPLLGKHNASNLLGAITLALGLGLTPTEVQQGLKTFQGLNGRSEIRELPGPLKVICDYYNAQPASVAAGLDLLVQLSPSSGSRWICLGDMLELGPDEEKFHRELAQKIQNAGISHVLLYGSRMKALEDELHHLAFKGTFAHFSSHQDLGNSLVSRIQPGDAVLIKGSRGMKMEEVWKILESCVKPISGDTLESKNHSSNT